MERETFEFIFPASNSSKEHDDQSIRIDDDFESDEIYEKSSIINPNYSQNTPMVGNNFSGSETDLERNTFEFIFPASSSSKEHDDQSIRIDDDFESDEIFKTVTRENKDGIFSDTFNNEIFLPSDELTNDEGILSNFNGLEDSVVIIKNLEVASSLLNDYMLDITNEKPKQTHFNVNLKKKNTDRVAEKPATPSKSQTPKKEKNTKIFNHDLAEILTKSHKIIMIENILYYWDDDTGYFKNIEGENMDFFLRMNVPSKYKHLITSYSSQEIYKWIKYSNIEKANNNSLNRRKSYVAFSNCIVDINDFSTYSHDPSFYFTSIINTKYPKNKKKYGYYFEKFIKQITGDDNYLYLRLQELFGYVISEIRDVKAIPFLIGPKDSGKSIVLKILEYLIGSEFVSNLSLKDFNDPQYLSSLLGKKLNACGEVSEVALTRLDAIKMLSGGDPITARFLYGQPFKLLNKAVLLFAGNQLPVIKGIDKSNAFSKRIVIFPFNHPVPKNQQDPYLFDKLINETSYIAKWALIGLNRWHNNNYQFTSNEIVEKISNAYLAETNSVESFVESSCILDSDSRTHNETLLAAYKLYCQNDGLNEVSSKSFYSYLKTQYGLRTGRFWIDNNSKHGFYGIKLDIKS